MRNRARIYGFVAGACLLLAGAAVRAEDAVASAPAPTDWVYPLIKDYGGVHPRAELPVRPDPGVDYKVIVDVVHGPQDPARVGDGLVRLARLRNLMAYAQVPSRHVHLVAVIEGAAGFAALTDAAYNARFKVDNPNLALLHQLRQAGVELLVCGQALAENDIPDSALSPDVTVTLSALSDFAVYGQRGYTYMQL